MTNHNNDGMTETVHELKVGTCGWDEPLWQGSFYPEELPEDWRLSFLGSQVRAVQVPPEQWQGLDAAGLEQWREDTYPEFRFVLALMPDSSSRLESALERLQWLAAGLGEQLGAWLLRLDARALAADDWRPLLSKLGKLAPLCLDAGGLELSPEWQALCEDLYISRCWRPEIEPAPAPQGRLLVALTSETDGREQRRIIDALAAWMGESRQAILLFEGAAAPVAARQARMVAELLGV